MSQFSRRSRNTPHRGERDGHICHLLSDRWGWARVVVLGAGIGGIALCAAGAGAESIVRRPAAAVAVEEIWATKVPEFRADAPVDAKVTVLYFTATWCGYCDQMDRTTLSNRDVRARLGAVERVKIDYDQQPELVAKYQIRGVPAFVLVNARGEEIARSVGATKSEAFIAWLDAGRTRATDLAKAAAQRQAELKKLAAILEAKGDEAWDATKALVFDLAARGETDARAFALKQLATRAEGNPAALRDGLLHADLAVRIAVAGVLRKRLGEGFVYDPWADAEARETAVGRMGFVEDL